MEALFTNTIFMPTLVAYLSSLLGKILTLSWQRKRLTFRQFWRDGGMPSSHTSLTVGLTTAIFLTEGMTSVFFVALAFSLVVMHDAIGIRYEAGQHAKTLKMIIAKLRMGKEVKTNKFKEILGHTPLQVVGGILVGMGMATLTYFVM